MVLQYLSGPRRGASVQRLGGVLGSEPAGHEGNVEGSTRRAEVLDIVMDVTRTGMCFMALNSKGFIKPALLSVCSKHSQEENGKILDSLARNRTRSRSDS